MDALLAYNPLPGGILMSRQGPRPSRRTWHNGIDLGAPVGSAVHAIGAGTVAFVDACGYTCPYGNRIVIRHADEVYSVYAHLETIRVALGQEVPMGWWIATSGDTTDLDPDMVPHLHLEVSRKVRAATTDYAARYDVLSVLAADGIVLEGNRLVAGAPREYHEPLLLQVKTASFTYVPTVIGPEDGSSPWPWIAGGAALAYVGWRLARRR